MSLSGDNAGDLGSAIQSWWSNEWIPRNKEWVQVWNRGYASEFTMVLLYDEEFSDAPRVVGCDGPQLRFRLLGKPSAKWWKDWLVRRIVSDLKAQFPAVGKLVSAQNCE
jgi:hypothetical protein